MAYEDIYEGLTDDEKEKMIKADIPKLNGIFMTIWLRRHKGHSPESSEGWGWYDAIYIRGREVDDEENKKMVIFWRWRLVSFARGRTRKN